MRKHLVRKCFVRKLSDKKRLGRNRFVTGNVLCSKLFVRKRSVGKLSARIN